MRFHMNAATKNSDSIIGCQGAQPISGKALIPCTCRTYEQPESSAKSPNKQVIAAKIHWL
jgi:hypothetical protein